MSQTGPSWYYSYSYWQISPPPPGFQPQPHIPYSHGPPYWRDPRCDPSWPTPVRLGGCDTERSDSKNSDTEDSDPESKCGSQSNAYPPPRSSASSGSQSTIRAPKGGTKCTCPKSNSSQSGRSKRSRSNSDRSGSRSTVTAPTDGPKCSCPKSSSSKSGRSKSNSSQATLRPGSDQGSRGAAAPETVASDQDLNLRDPNPNVTLFPVRVPSIRLGGNEKPKSKGKKQKWFHCGRTNSTSSKTSSSGGTASDRAANPPPLPSIPEDSIPRHTTDENGRLRRPAPFEHIPLGSNSDSSYYGPGPETSQHPASERGPSSRAGSGSMGPNPPPLCSSCHLPTR